MTAHRKRGLVLNIGSFAGAVPSPMLATYSGTKAFLATFTSALAEEVRAHNIVVEHVNTYFVVCPSPFLLGPLFTDVFPFFLPFFHRMAGLQTLQNPAPLAPHPHAPRVRALRPLQNRACVWCGGRRAPGH
jgi:NAD(P)-dependent dehydrogenase (short-subunit alcohol dehydrogenase family)